MVHSHSALEHRQEHANLAYGLILRGEGGDGGVEDETNRLALLLRQRVDRLGTDGRSLALLAREGEDDRRRAPHANQLAKQPHQLVARSRAHLSSGGAGVGGGERGAGSVVCGVLEVSLVIDEHVQPTTTQWVHPVLERRWPVRRGDEMARFAVRRCDPCCELGAIWDGRREEDKAHRLWQEDDALLPYDAALLVSHVVHLVKDDPLDLAHELVAPVEHVAQDLCRHHKARRLDVHIDVAGHQAHLRDAKRREVSCRDFWLGPQAEAEAWCTHLFRAECGR